MGESIKMKTIFSVTNVVPLDGYKLALAFSDGSSGIADLSNDVREDDLREIADPVNFIKAHVSGSSVSWSDNVDLAAEFLHARVHDMAPPETPSDVELNKIEVSLRGLRTMHDYTQNDLAAAAKMAQGDISKLERRDDALVSSLRRYVESLGAKLDLVVTLKDGAQRKVRLGG